MKLSLSRLWFRRPISKLRAAAPRMLSAVVPLEDRVQPATFTVSNLLDAGVGSLRDAITAANSAAGADVIDASGVTGSIALLTVLPNIAGNVIINGPAVGVLAVTRDVGAANFRIFSVTDGAASVVDARFNNLTITNGSTVDGGGLHIGIEKVTLTNCIISNNVASHVGGGIFAAGPTPDLTLINCTITGNSATGNGGGAYFGYDGKCTVIGSTVTGNVSGGTGAGLYFYGTGSAATNWVVQSSTISGNSASVSGGGIGMLGGGNKLLVQSSTITNNTAGSGGGIGTGNAADLTTLENTIVSGNIASVPDIASAGLVAAKFSAIGDATGFTLTDNGNNLPFGAVLNLGLLANNGGTTLTHLPGVGSAAINAGTNILVQGIDQRNFQRTVGANVDIGAIEAGASQPSGNVPNVDLVTTFGATQYKVIVTYFDDVGIQATSLGSNDLTVTGPGGALTFLSVTPNTGVTTPLTATYLFTPPGGSWDLSDNGTYLIQSIDGQVTDANLPTANGITGGILGQFKVQLNVVTNSNDAGVGSLRQAILDSNASVGELNTIAFAVGTGPITITPLTPLPTITDPVVIDGTTQPGFAGAPLVQVAGNLAGTGANGLDLLASNNTIRGFVINRFASGAGIRIGGSSSNNVVQFNYIGTTSAGTAALPNDVGVLITGGVSGNLIGSNLDLVNDNAERNLISGNTSAGVRGGAITSPLKVFQWTTGAGANGHYYVVTPSTSWANAESIAVANGGHLTSISDANENTFVASLGNGWIGLTDDTAFGGSEFGNTSGAPNRGEGFIWSDGTPAPYPVGGPLSGFQSWNGGEPNDANGEDYIEIGGNGGWNDLPASSNRPGFLEFNTSPNLQALAAAFGVNSNRIQGNGIGTNLASNAAIANGIGIELGASSNVTIRENLLSGNTAEAIRHTTTPYVPTVQWTSGTGFNGHYYLLTPPAFFGAAEAAAVAAGGHLASITSAEEQAFIAATFLPDLGNNEAWMGYTDTAVEGTFVWLTGEPTAYTNWGPGEPNNSGDYATFNFNNNGTWDDNGSGIQKRTLMEFDSPPNQAALAGLFGGGGSNLIQDNFIGTNRPGTAAIANGAGIELGNANGVTVRGNVISGNTGDAVRATSTFSLPTVQWTTGTGANNHFYILTPASTFVNAEAAAVAAGGHLASVTSIEEETFLTAAYATALGGNAAWMGFTDAGQAINDFKWTTGEPTVYINWAPGEPNNSGDFALFNYQGAMQWDDTGDGSRPTIMEFDTAPNQAALAALFDTSGVHTIIGNAIGSNAGLTAALPNGDAGITINNVRSVTIGGTGANAANIIRSSGGAGVAVTGPNATGMTVRGNAIFANTGLGIDLGTAGVTPNDALDADRGPNNLTNFPVIGAVTPGGTTTVSGIILGAPNSAMTLDFYANAAGTQGQRYLGTASVTTDAAGVANYNGVVLNAASTAGEIITATSTDPSGSTSEFSAGTTAGDAVATGFTVNAGNAQRSRITRIEVQFSGTVSAANYQGAAAAVLVRTGAASIPTGVAGDIVQSGPTAPSHITVTQGTATSLVFTFDNSGLTVNSNSVGVESGSLTDGYWRLTVGGFQSGLNDLALRRLYGDSTNLAGGVVDGADSIAFGNAFNSNTIAFDFNNDGTVDGSDLTIFGNRFSNAL